MIPPQPAGLVYVDYIERRGTELFRFVSESDLEGIVAKHVASPYADYARAWLKIKNLNYTQAPGRREMFEGFRGHAREDARPSA